MSQILAINAGSSSYKLSLFEQQENGLQPLFQAQTKTISELQKRLTAISASTLIGIGHRIVHGGSQYSDTVRINDKVIADLESLSEIAPLHNQAAIDAIKACFGHFGKEVPEVAVFDTAFHSHMPEVASYYAIPLALAKKHGIKRYGFHGISHAFMWDTFHTHTGQKQAKVITLQLGAGCSVAAIENGRSIDTSMGFSPAEGLVMATRAGNIDAEVVPYLAKRENRSAEEIVDLLNFKSGLLGVSGFSSDMKELLSLSNKNAQVHLAIDLFCYRIVQYLGAYMATLAGLDAIIFSGGIGEHSPQIRQMIIDKMRWFQIELNSSVNLSTIDLTPGSIEQISSISSSVSVFVVATDENRLIARELLHCLQAESSTELT